MDIGGGQNDEDQQDINISDVFEAISLADPSYVGGVVDAMSRQGPTGPYVRIVEQPASRALRFRYPCEGRSAGSLPGVNSTNERKTYPTIEIRNFVGKAVVFVSCVTKDEPYKPHPHKLVGREYISRGVSTQKVEVTPDCCQFSFTNLGIQCVKRKDVEASLADRESLKVDPFKTGYAHRQQPNSIDLNAIRLCFQVFLHNEATGEHRTSLRPVVSNVIYDKKAMGDLHILRVSHYSGPATGGTEVILLCEKVNREGTEVIFTERDASGAVVWEERATIVATHKQCALVFETPPYRRTDTRTDVPVNFRLVRKSDDTCSNEMQFLYTPNREGTPPSRRKRPLAALTALVPLAPLSPRADAVSSSTDADITAAVTSTDSEPTVADVNGNTLASDPTENALDDLLDQVAELDEIYSENRTRLENVRLTSDDTDDDFNDAGTYTSLQLAFRNPVAITDPEPYEDVQVQTYRGPIIEFAPLKRDTDDDKAPPLPPKRVRKTSESFKTSQTSVNSILKPGKQLPVTRNVDVLKQRNSELTSARSEPALPPAPKKRGFLSRLFRRKDKSPAPSVKSEGRKETKSKPIGRSVSSVSGLRPSKFKSSVSHTSLKDNASGTGLSYADSITHISLHGDDNEKCSSQSSLRRPNSLAPLPPTDGGTILVAESVLALDADAFRKLQDDLDLTEAEHYALYMAVAPHATVSEFDETSCYYSPVDGSKFHEQN